MRRNTDLDTSPEIDKARLQYPTDQSEWYNLNLIYKPARKGKKLNLTSPNLYESQPKFDIDEFEENANHSAPIKVVSNDNSEWMDDEMQQQSNNNDYARPRTRQWAHGHIFHYHRIRQHLRSNFNLYTQL